MQTFNDTYKTIQSEAQGLFKEKGSRFISFAFNINDESQVKDHVNMLRRKYHDARHICYAFRLGHNEFRFRSNDDGEPSGTAGKPILGQITSHDLTDILIVVIRYFGGVLLGTSGLIIAYRSAAMECLKNASIIEKTIDKNFRVSFHYEQLNGVMKIIKDEHIVIVEQNLDCESEMFLIVPQSAFEKVKNRLLKIEKLIFRDL
jgi:uncharacterized YigZ family protein